jgi:metal-dependent hydrolase (beta-lactamase superfamily II)
MARPKRALLLVTALLLVGVGGITAWGYGRYTLGAERAERLWRDYRPQPLTGVGSTRSLSILPLADWHTASPELRGEMGVSYLVETDGSSVLFDVGNNAEQADPSPLLHNMQVLGVTTADFDTVVISHNHFDHIGGWRWFRRGSFSLGNEQVDLSGKRVFTPVPMNYPGLQPVHTPEPTVIAPGVATTGTIARQLRVGWVEEQALAIHVQGKGIVLIVGCGHQTLGKVLQRSETLFSEPIHGVIGGLHYPVPTGRATVLGLNVQRLAATGSSPFGLLTQDGVTAQIELLGRRRPGIVGVGGHDTSDEVIEQFRRRFGSAYRSVTVGQRIVIGEPPGTVTLPGSAS